MSVVTAEEITLWLTHNKNKAGRYVSVGLKAIVGLSFLIFFFQFGRPRFFLFGKTAEAQGRVVSYQIEHFAPISDPVHAPRPSFGYMPVVEYQAEGRLIYFEDWLGRRYPEAVNSSVKVIYNPSNPSQALIDRSLWNWFPWAPMIAVGLLSVLSAIKDWLAPLAEGDESQFQPRI